jgi:hypothetical protein
MLSLFGGLIAFGASVAHDLPLWTAALLYAGVGSLILMLSLGLQLWADQTRHPPRQPALAPRRAAKMRVLHASH